MELADLADDELLARVHAILVAACSWQRPWARQPGLADCVLDWRHEDRAEPMSLWVARADDEVVGAARLWLPMDDNTSMCWFEVEVDPQHRRRGAGRALVQTVLAHARRHGRSTVLAEAHVPPGEHGHPHHGFARALGFDVTSTDVVRHLDLPVATGLLESLDEQARPHWEERYRLATHVNGVPAHDLAGLCAVMNRLIVDAPSGELEFEPESMTPARYEEYRQLWLAQGRTRISTLAYERATGAVVAYTDLVLPADATDVAWQWGTLVHGEHRGHRLGTAIKVANLRHLQAEHPERTRVVTQNDGTNRWMVDINARLGFRVVEESPSFRRVLT